MHFKGGDINAGLAKLLKPADAMIDDLLWWADALKMKRGSTPDKK